MKPPSELFAPPLPRKNRPRRVRPGPKKRPGRKKIADQPTIHCVTLDKWLIEKRNVLCPNESLSQTLNRLLKEEIDEADNPGERAERQLQE